LRHAIKLARQDGFCSLLRRANLLGLVWPMFDLDVAGGTSSGGTLEIPGTEMKNRRALMLPLSGRFLAVVDRRWQAGIETCAHLFHHHLRPVVRFDAVWREAAARIGQPHLILHDLRRSGARTLIGPACPRTWSYGWAVGERGRC
jgi:integrase